jgi:hypothetical protein
MGSEPQSPGTWWDMALAFVVSFLGGLLIGGILFPHKSNQTQVTTGDTPAALSLLNNSQATLR